jgi:hypothetical protein
MSGYGVNKELGGVHVKTQARRHMKGRLLAPHCNHKWFESQWQLEWNRLWRLTDGVAALLETDATR